MPNVHWLQNIVWISDVFNITSNVLIVSCPAKVTVLKLYYYISLMYCISALPVSFLLCKFLLHVLHESLLLKKEGLMRLNACGYTYDFVLCNYIICIYRGGPVQQREGGSEGRWPFCHRNSPIRLWEQAAEAPLLFAHDCSPPAQSPVGCRCGDLHLRFLDRLHSAGQSNHQTLECPLHPYLVLHLLELCHLPSLLPGSPVL